MRAVVPVSQLSYASIEARGGRGGWQVVARSGPAAEELQEAMLAGVLTILDAPPLPRFPSADDIARLPRRLLALPLPDDSDRIGVWHSAPAGADVTGRPGNVFTHAAVLSKGESNFRPISLWRSVSWLTPYGADQVRVAQLPDALEVPDGFAGEAAAFVLDLDVWRKGTLAVLLDAVSAALRGGPLVVLATESCDHAALWIKAVSMCMTAGRAQSFAVSTWESVGAREGWARQGLHMVCVPRVDAQGLPTGADLVVIDDSTDPELGDWLGQPHRLASGGEVAVTPWSILVLDRLFTIQDGIEMVHQLDSLVEEIHGDSPDPSWALGMLVALGGDHPIEGPLAAALAKAAPEAVKDHAKAYRLTTRAVQEVAGRETEERWVNYRELVAGGGSSFSAQLAALAYVESALSDEAWLLAEDGERGRFPQEEHLEPPQEVIGTLRVALRREEQLFPEQRSRRAVHLLDLGSSLVGEDASLHAELQGCARKHVLPFLGDESHAVGLTRTTVLGPGARRILLEELEREGSPSPLPWDAVQWLELDLKSLLERDPHTMAAGPSPLVTSAAFAAARSSKLPAAVQDRVSMVLAWRLVLGRGTPQFRQAAAAELAAHPATAGDVAWIRERFGDVLQPTRAVEAFLPTLLAAPRSAELDALLDLFSWHPDRVASGVAQARRGALAARSGTWADMGARTAIIQPLLRAWNRVVALGGGRVDSELAGTVVLMRMLNQVERFTPWEEQLRGILDQATFTDRLWREAAGGFADWARGHRSVQRLGAGHRVAFVALLMVRNAWLPLSEGDRAPLMPLPELTSTQGTPLFQTLLEEVLSSLEPTSVGEGVLDAARAPSRTPPAAGVPVDDRALEKQERETEKALRGWLREHGIEARRKGTFGLPRFGKGQE